MSDENIQKALCDIDNICCIYRSVGEAMYDEVRVRLAGRFGKRLDDLTARLAAAEAEVKRRTAEVASYKSAFQGEVESADEYKAERDEALQRLAEAEAERDVERKDRVAAEFEMLELRERRVEAESRDTYYDRNDVVPELLHYADFADHVESRMMKQAAKEIAELRRCIRYTVDAYCLANEFSDGHKQVVISDQWHVWAQTLILNRTFTAALEGKP